MSAAALENVWDDLVSAIEGIRTGDGYRTTVHTVTTDPTPLLSWPAQQTPMVCLLFDADRSRQTPDAFGEVDDQLVFVAEWRIDAPGLTESVRRQAISDWLTDLEHAVTVDVSRGGVAWDTEIQFGPGGPWTDPAGAILGTSTITVHVSRARGVA